MFDSSMSDREILERILDIFDNDIVVWKSDYGEEHYEPKGEKQELYRKIYEFRLSFHNVMVMKKVRERLKKEGVLNDSNS